MCGKVGKAHPLTFFPSMSAIIRPSGGVGRADEHSLKLPIHPNIVPFNIVLVDMPLSLHQLLTEAKNIGREEKLHIGRQLCAVLIHCQEHHCAVVEWDPKEIYILPPRAHEVAHNLCGTNRFFTARYCHRCR